MRRLRNFAVNITYRRRVLISNVHCHESVFIYYLNIIYFLSNSTTSQNMSINQSDTNYSPVWIYDLIRYYKYEYGYPGKVNTLPFMAPTLQDMSLFLLDDKLLSILPNRLVFMMDDDDSRKRFQT